MRPPCSLGGLACLFVVLGLAGTTFADGPKTALTCEDLYRLDSPTSVALAPDRKSAVYVRQWIDAATKRERNSLWLVEGEASKARPLEANEPDARAPLFSPDGKWVVFLSTRPRPDGWKPAPPVPPESDPAVDLWLLPAAGGRAVPLAGPDKPYGRVFNDGFYGRVAFSPDGRRLAFVADDGRDPRTPEEREADVVVVRPDQGEGYTGYGPAQVWVAELDAAPGLFAASRVQRLTEDDVWYGDPQWSPDGRSLVVHANRTEDRESVRFSINRNFDLWAIDVATRSLHQLTSGPGPDVAPRFLPDGKRLVYLTVPRRGTHRDVFNLAVLTFGGGGPRSTVVFDHHGPGAEDPPHLPPSFPLPYDSAQDPDGFYYNADRGTDTVLVNVNLRSGRGTILDGPVKVFGPVDVSFLFRSVLRQSLTPPSNTFLEGRLPSQTRVVRWDNGEGQTIEGVLTLPPEAVAKPPYKLILFPHGGPHSRSAIGLNFTAEVFAAQGYAVFQPNFRGSSGYGQKFIDADRFDFGGGDMRDILSGIDHLVKEKLIDRDRQFVYGVSYGGYMTCWLVGQTRQFKAAVAQNAVTDLAAMWGLSDLQSWTEWEFGGRPWEVPAAMRKHSPLSHVGNVKTPTLVLHSREDRRCPLPMGLMFHRALQAHGVPTQMVIYPGEGHGIRQPRHRVDVLRRTLAWFAAHEK